MKNRKMKVATLLVILALFLVLKSYAQENSEVQTFYDHYEAGLDVDVKAPTNTGPGEKINVSVSFHCHSKDLVINYLYVTIYDFKSGEEKTPIETVTLVEEGTGYDPQNDENLTKTYEVEIPEDAWDITYGEVSYQWELPGHVYTISDYGFTMTYVRNVKMEDLIAQLANKTQEYDRLWQNFTQLNQTYWDLASNETLGTEVELGNTRLAMIIFIIATVFFAATTIYLMVRKPREYW